MAKVTVFLEINELLKEALKYLAVKEPLPIKFKMHKLTGNNKGKNEFHLKGDLIVMYEIYENKLILKLIDVGSHRDVLGIE
ncbi:MAG: type II toxin-antitoxin system mRNA interferase toxin, RelE/StbE family [Succinivibrionaceae bacterium]|nr:type II toxin-antitoxin system mRNA interferase toxin, RelE/StbE family [Succinivibrionaceae bacterium]